MAAAIKIWVTILAYSLVSKADTVTSRDSRSWNGSVVEIRGGVLTLSAHFPSGAPVSLQFGPNTLRAIEFNPTTFNPGAAPKLTPVSGGALSGTIYLRDKSGHKCANITINAQTVSCSAGSWSQQKTLRIIFDGR